MHVKSVPYLYVKAKVIVVDNLGREHNDTISGVWSPDSVGKYQIAK